MIILTHYTAATYKAQIRSSPDCGLKVLYTATCTMGEEHAARAVVSKWFGEASAQTIRRADRQEIDTLMGAFFKDPKRKQVFTVWTFTPTPTRPIK